MATVFLLPCWVVDLGDDKAEVYGSKSSAVETCRRCFDLEEACPHSMKDRAPRRMYLVTPKASNEKDSAHGKEEGSAISGT